MKLLIAAEIFPPDIGGPATYSQKLAEELSKHQGWQVKIICYSDKIENDNVIRILRQKNPIKHYLNYSLKLLKLAKDCDLIYAQGPISSGLPAIIVGFLRAKKVVVKVVGDYAWEQARNLGKTNLGIDEFQKQRPTGKIGWLKKIEGFVCGKATKVIVPSQYLKGIVMGWGVPEEKIEAIYNSFEFRKLELQKNKETIISIGRLVPWKGFIVLIEAVSELIGENYNFNLTIIGEGPEGNKLREKIKSLNLDHKITIAALPHNLVLETLNIAAIFVLNSEYEGLSHTILEAMASEVPIIATNTGGNPELIKDQENGILIEYNNKEQLKETILKLYNNPELRQKFIENSKEVLKKFTFENMINQTIKTLQSV